VFALTVPDAWTVFRAAARYDVEDAYARKVAAPLLTPPPPVTRIGVPDEATREFFGDTVQAHSFTAALGQLSDIGAKIVELDFTPFYEVAKMLYEGAWVADRLSVIEDLLTKDSEAVHPVTRQIISGGAPRDGEDQGRCDGSARSMGLAEGGLRRLCRWCSTTARNWHG
jgi:allophanate hydrolase